MTPNLEISLANLSFLTLFISMISYWIQTSTFVLIINPKLTSVLSMKTSTKNHELLVNNSSANHKLNVNTFFDLIERFKNYFTTGLNFGTLLMLISNLSIFFVLVLRWEESGHFPLSNLYESLMFLSWSLTFIHLFIELNIFNLNQNNYLSYSLGLTNKTKACGHSLQVANQKNFFVTKLIGSITSPCALFTNAFASFSLPDEMQASSPLVPALQSNWLMMHVTVMILSYAALILGSLLSIGFLIITGGKEINQEQIIKNKRNSNLNINSFNFLSKQTETPLSLSFTLDNLSYRILGIGFPLLTIGILSGAVWANEAWGSYWSWDPKETWALLTWLVFAIYLHTRLTKGWQGKKPALIASVGFITVWICYLGVNLIGEGLHSYGWLS